MVLHTAAYYGDIGIMDMLLRHSDCDINARTLADMVAPLHVAALLNQAAIVDLLLQQSQCDINAFNNDGYNALGLCCPIQ